MQLRIQCLCVDTADPGRLAAFWQSALGWRRTFGQGTDVSWVVMADPDGNEFCVLKPLTRAQAD